jgi:hypothetical protein
MYVRCVDRYYGSFDIDVMESRPAAVLGGQKAESKARLDVLRWIPGQFDNLTI